MMIPARHRTLLGCLLSLAASGCTAAADGGREPAGASGGAIAIQAPSRAAATDGAWRDPPAPHTAAPIEPASAPTARGALEPADRTVGPGLPDLARSPGPARPARPQRLLYRRLP